MGNKKRQCVDNKELNMKNYHSIRNDFEQKKIVIAPY